MAVTIKEIAKAAGVNVSTVSRSLNGDKGVGEETRERIVALAHDLGYKPNILAKSLKNGATRMICLLVPDIKNLIFPQIARGVEDVAREKGYIVVLCNSDDNPQTERFYIESMAERQVAGFVMCTAQKGEDNVLYMIEKGIPCVLVNRFREEFFGKVDCIGINNYKASYETMKCLYERGYRKIAFAKGNQDLIFNHDRYQGYLDFLKDVGLPLRNEWVMKKNDDDFYDETIRMMSMEERPDCIFAGSDPKAFYILKALSDLNIKVPEEIGVMGFDNVEMAQLISPALSTVSQPLYGFGKAACESLIRQIDHKNSTGELPKAETVFMNYELKMRNTTR